MNPDWLQDPEVVKKGLKQDYPTKSRLFSENSKMATAEAGKKPKLLYQWPIITNFITEKLDNWDRAQLTPWLDRLSQFDMDVHHVYGKTTKLIENYDQHPSMNVDNGMPFDEKYVVITPIPFFYDWIKKMASKKVYTRNETMHSNIKAATRRQRAPKTADRKTIRSNHHIRGMIQRQTEQKNMKLNRFWQQ